MEKNNYTDNFEYYLRNQTEGFKMYPSKRVWHSIYNNLHPAKKWPSAAVTMLLFSVLIFIGYLHNGQQNIAGNIPSQKTGNDAVQNNTKQITPQNNITVSAASNSNDVNQANKTIASLDKKSNETFSRNIPAINNTGDVSARNDENRRNRRITGGGVTPQRRNNSLPGAEKRNILIAENNIPENAPADITLPPTAGEKKNIEADVKIAKPEDAKPEPVISKVNEIPAKKDAIISNTPAEENQSIIPDRRDNIENTPAASATTEQKHLSISNEDKAFMDHFALENKMRRNKWKAQTGWEFYVAGGMSYRNLSANTEMLPTNSFAAFNNVKLNSGLNHTPSVSVEAGASLIHRFAKDLRWKAGIQANYTSYNIAAFELGHPVLTTLQMKDANSGYPVMKSYLSNISSSISGRPVSLNNNTLQLSIPIGADVRLAGKDRLQWYAGATVQGSFIVSSKANIISSDRNYYINDPSLVRKWNLNTSAETFITYKTNSGITLRAGPQLRYQALSTYTKLFSLTEKPYSLSLKLGIQKSF